MGVCIKFLIKFTKSVWEEYQCLREEHKVKKREI